MRSVPGTGTLLGRCRVVYTPDAASRAARA